MMDRRRIYQGCDKGRVRPHNEDIVLVDESLGLSIVADGVGGHRAGDRAARIVADSVYQTLKDQTWAIDALRNEDASVQGEDVAKVIRFALQRANLTIYEEANKIPDYAGMATTCTLALDLGKRALLAHVGDSRGYVIRAGEVVRVTEDHVVATTGLSKLGPGAKPVKQRVLSRAIGSQPECKIDVMWLDVRPDDVLLLCSDGLSDLLVSDEEIWEVISTFGAEPAPEVLIDLANTRGGRDNISVAVWDVAPGILPDHPSAEKWAESKGELQLLRELGPLAALTYLELEDLRAHARVDMYRRDALISPDPNVPSIAIVVKGEAEVLCAGGKRFRVKSGGVIGETALTLGGSWPYQVVAATNLVMVVLPVQALTAFISHRPRASTRLLWSLLGISNERLSQIVGGSGVLETLSSSSSVARRSEPALDSATPPTNPFPSAPAPSFGAPAQPLATPSFGSALPTTNPNGPSFGGTAP